MFFRHYVDLFDPLGVELMEREAVQSQGTKLTSTQPITGKRLLYTCI